MRQAALRRPGLHTRAPNTLVAPRKHQLLRNPRASSPGDDSPTSAGLTPAGYSRPHAVRKSPSAVFHGRGRGGGRRRGAEAGAAAGGEAGGGGGAMNRPARTAPFGLLFRFPAFSYFTGCGESALREESKQDVNL